MASPQVGSVSAKLSFAKVAAMHPPSMSPIPSGQKAEDKKSRASGPSNGPKPPQNTKTQSPALPIRLELAITENLTQTAGVEQVAGAIEGLSLVKDSLKVVNGATGPESGESMEDDQSHLSNSSLKQQSFETKSMASVTTFAMDEKESLRPDDSASVRAADDDDLTSESTKATIFQHDVEATVPGVRGASRKDTNSVTIPHRRYHTLTLSNPPRFGDLPVTPVLESEEVDRISSPRLSEDAPEDCHVHMPAPPTAPDEKLLEALATSKDRLPLLQLEERILSFIHHSREEYVDLPPQNSFARLLAHKLSDYYNLIHHINDDGNSIRIFRTPCVSLPTSLAMLARSIVIGPAQTQGSTAVTIMRRAGIGPLQSSIGGSTAASSSAPSKPTSEAGVETNSDEGIFSPPAGTPSRDKSKLTWEEREAQYRAARERIFGDYQEPPTSEGVSTGENSASMSRSSSSSGRRKNRRQKNPKDDSFEARSAFVPSFASSHLASTPGQYNQQFIDQGYQAGYGGPSTPFGLNGTHGTTSAQSYSGYDHGMTLNTSGPYGVAGHNFTSDTWQTMQSAPSSGYYNYHQGAGNYQQNMSNLMPQLNNQFITNTGQGMTQPQNWMNNQFQPQYPQHGNQTSPNPNGTQWSGYSPSQNMPNTASYQYGQLPPQSQSSNSTYSQQHPIPGSYTRSLFNPQTRSFVPSGSSTRLGGRNGRKKSVPSATPNRNGTPLKQYGSGSNTGNSSQSSRRMDLRGGDISSIKAQEDSLQQKYGAPAHLPKKPPPSQVPSTYDVETISHATPVNGPLVVNGGINSSS